MIDTGRLVVRARFDRMGLGELGVELTRPSVTRLFLGQSPDAVCKTVPYLFTLCANAQRAAAQAAVAVARGEAPRVFDSGELWREVLHENLWRLLLDWPPALGLPPAREAFIDWRNRRQGGDYPDATRKLFECCLQPMSDKCLAILGEHRRAESLPDDRQEPPPTATLSPEAWLAYWQGCSSHMPTMPRPASIRSVFMARLAETEAALDALVCAAPFPLAGAGGNGWGVGQTLTARGVLTHAVHLVDGKVADYRVQAPTDNFFADAAALSSLLANLEFTSLDQARQVLNQAILALDPCLPYVVELQDA